MTNDAKIKKQLPGKDQIQTAVRKIWSKEEAKDINCKTLFKTTERFKVAHHRPFQIVEQPIKTSEEHYPLPLQALKEA